jgi:hypothetical protein
MAQGMHGSIGVKGEFVAAVFEAFDFGHGAGTRAFEQTSDINNIFCNKRHQIWADGFF